MKRVGDLFEKYRTRMVAPQATVEKVCIEVVAEVAGVTLTEKQVSYTVATRTVSLQVPSVVKSELRFHHEAILSNLRRRIGKTNCPEVIM